MSNDDALRFLLTLGATKWQYTNGVRNTEDISPDNWSHVQPLLDREGNQEIQLQSFGDLFISNPDLPERFLHNAALNKTDLETRYGGTEKGYIDYPVLN